MDTSTQVRDILTFLNDQKPASHATRGRSTWWSNCLIWAAALCFVVLLVLGGARWTIGYLPASLIYVALVMGLGAQVLSILAMSIDTCAGLIFIFLFQKRAAEMRLVEFAHDSALVKQLAASPRAALEAADFWLAQYVGREERRLKLVFPGVEGLAAFSVVGGAWSVLKDLPEAQAQLAKHVPLLANGGLASGMNTTLTLLFALAFGITFGAMLKLQAMHRVAYQRDLLALALRP